MRSGGDTAHRGSTVAAAAGTTRCRCAEASTMAGHGREAGEFAGAARAPVTHHWRSSGVPCTAHPRGSTEAAVSGSARCSAAEASPTS